MCKTNEELNMPFAQRDEENMQIDAWDAMITCLCKQFTTLDKAEVISGIEFTGDIHLALGNLTDKHLANLVEQAEIERSL
jgi:hypothetical protein